MSCSHVESGKVVSKDYEPYREYTTTTFSRVGNVSVPVTMHHRDYEDWTITINGYEGSSDDKEDELVYVSKKVYDNLNIGDYFTFDENKHSYRDNNNRKRKQKKK